MHISDFKSAFTVAYPIRFYSRNYSFLKWDLTALAIKYATISRLHETANGDVFEPQFVSPIMLSLLKKKIPESPLIHTKHFSNILIHNSMTVTKDTTLTFTAFERHRLNWMKIKLINRKLVVSCM